MELKQTHLHSDDLKPAFSCKEYILSMIKTRIHFHRILCKLYLMHCLAAFQLLETDRPKLS